MVAEFYETCQVLSLLMEMAKEKYIGEYFKVNFNKIQSMQLARRQNPSSFINLFEVGQISIFYKVKNMKNISHVQNLNILVDILLAHVQCPLPSMGVILECVSPL